MKPIILVTLMLTLSSVSALDLYEEVAAEPQQNIYDLTIDDFVAANQDSNRNQETYSPCHLADAMNYLDPDNFVEEEAKQIDWDTKAKDGEVSIFFVEQSDADYAHQGEVKVMGITEKEAVLMSNDPGGEACSNKHNQGDVANRWCHAVIVDYINRGLMSAGVNPIVSHVAASAFFLPKEYLYDKNPSLSDMGGPDITVYEKNNSKVTITPFADGAVFVTVDKRL